MNFKKIIRATTAVLAAFCAVLFISIGYLSTTLPDHFYYDKDTEFHFVNSNYTVKSVNNSSGGDILVNSQNSNANVYSVKLFNIIPIKEVYVKENEQVTLTPVGKPFGIKMLSQGVIVNGLSSITTGKGEKQPAQKAGIQVGDIVISINGKEVMTNKEISAIVKESDGHTLQIKAKRNGKEMTFKVVPAKASEDSQYKIGMWVRDSTAGIGTMTFVDKKTGTFAGLGHGVNDVDTQDLVPLASGEIVDVKLTGIDKSMEGTPGQLKGDFLNNKKMGTLKKNTEIGIYGKLDSSVQTSGPSYPMAYKQEIKKGKAQILTSIDGGAPKLYDITVEKINLNSAQVQKNMVISVTDKRLLEETGGIVQGMSGSPIIQDGKIVGAVTHVFVNNPEKGYGIFCENMFDVAKTLN